MFKRTLYPFAHSIPAGHLDANEAPQDAALRELQEETGLRDITIKPFTVIDIPGDECRRGSDHHKWNVFIAKTDNEIVRLNDEGVSPVWVSLDKIATLDIVSPVRYLLEQYGPTLISR